MEDYTLPSVKQCQEFLRIINRGRKAVGLERIDVLHFDECEPASPFNCLSAAHLFEPAGFRTSERVVSPRGDANRVLVTALDMPATTDSSVDPAGFAIPREIKVVTDVFDAADDDNDLLAALRDRMVEAGVVAP